MAENTSGVKEWIVEQARAAGSDCAGGREPGAVDAGVAAAAGNDSKSLHGILNYKPFPKQCQFRASPAKYRLFGGAAGPGKSKALLMEAVVQALDHPNVITLLSRRTFPELEGLLLHYFRRDVPRQLYVAFHESKHLVEWTNGSTTRFGYCASEHDVYQYQGAEYLFIGIDELTLFILRQWQFLTSRNRCPVPGTFPCMAGATNPGNIGHAWVKALWIDKQAAPGMERPEEYNAKDSDFIPAQLFDNPIYAADKNFQKTLLALPPLEQRLAERVISADPTIRAIQARKAQLEVPKRAQPVSFFAQAAYLAHPMRWMHGVRCCVGIREDVGMTQREMWGRLFRANYASALERGVAQRRMATRVRREAEIRE